MHWHLVPSFLGVDRSKEIALIGHVRDALCVAAFQVGWTLVG